MYINLCFKRVISSFDVQFDEGWVADAKHQDYTNFEPEHPKTNGTFKLFLTWVTKRAKWFYQMGEKLMLDFINF